MKFVNHVEEGVILYKILIHDYRIVLKHLPVNQVDQRSDHSNFADRKSTIRLSFAEQFYNNITLDRTSFLPLQHFKVFEVR